MTLDYGDSLLAEEIDDLGIVYWNELPVGEVSGYEIPVNEGTYTSDPMMLSQFQTVNRVSV